MYNPIDLCYKKAIEQYGVVVAIGESQTKVLIRETSENNTYGIDYKKIISSNVIKQGDYVSVDGVKFLIIDIDQQYSQSIYNIGVSRETKELILIDSNNKKINGIVDRNKINIINSGGIEAEYDQYNFIIPTLGNNIKLNNEIVWDGGVYTVISVDTTKNGLYYITGKFNEVYEPHTYTISLTPKEKTLQETETYQIISTCTYNGEIVLNPSITYTSSDIEIATVDDKGLITAIKEGNCIITCTYNNISADLQLTVNAKPVEPVISYNYNFSQPIDNLQQFMTTTLKANKLVNGVADDTLKINYEFDSVGQSLIASKKVVITNVGDSSIKIKNSSVSSKTIIHLTVTDSANENTIVDTDITLTGM